MWVYSGSQEIKSGWQKGWTQPWQPRGPLFTPGSYGPSPEAASQQGSSSPPVRPPRAIQRRDPGGMSCTRDPPEVQAGEPGLCSSPGSQSSFPLSAVTATSALLCHSASFLFIVNSPVSMKDHHSTNLNPHFPPLWNLCPANSHCSGGSLLPSRWLLKTSVSSLCICPRGNTGSRQPGRLLSETEFTLTPSNPLTCLILCYVWHVQRNIEGWAKVDLQL